MRGFSCILLFFFVCAFITSCQALRAVLNGTKLELDSLYTTVGTPFENDTIVNVTLVHKKNIKCDFLPNLPPQAIKGHFLVYTGNVFDDNLFRPCMNHFMDAYTNAGYFARMAERAGAVGVLVRRFDAEEMYSGYRVAGFTKGIGIPVLVTSKKNIDWIVTNADNVTAFEIPHIPEKDRKFIQELKNVFRGLNIINCIEWPILALLTLYFTIVDFLMYRHADRKNRTIHPTLTKAAPCISAIFCSIWHIGDPFSYSLNPHFPATFFERFHFGFLFVTTCVLLKTWILAVGSKLKTERVFKISLYIINILTFLDALVTIIWVFVGTGFQDVALGFAVVTVAVCGVGFIYYGKDVVILLSKTTTGIYRNMSTKIVVFIVVFFVFVYTTVIIYMASVFGSVISEFVLQFVVALAFIIIYSVLYLRRHASYRSPPNSINSGGTSKGSGTTNSATARSAETRSNEARSNEARSGNEEHYSNATELENTTKPVSASVSV